MLLRLQMSISGRQKRVNAVRHDELNLDH
jgi:hypothetical protein